MSPEEYGERVRERVGDGPAYLSFDIDFVDPAFAPGTGTPEVGGPASSEAMSYLVALTGINFRGFDCVEVCPPYDPSGVTAGWPRACATKCSASRRSTSATRPRTDSFRRRARAAVRRWRRDRKEWAGQVTRPLRALPAWSAWAAFGPRQNPKRSEPATIARSRLPS